jgi:ribosome maturation factor RimP
LITKEYILELANKHLSNGSIYITSIKVAADKHITVLIDGDEGVTIKDCVALSRAIEGQLDREKEDFALDVSSHGATSPLILNRQYKKHIGRNFEIKLLDGNKLEGTLVDCNEKYLTLAFTVRENKTIGKGKVDITKQLNVDFDTIKESRIKLKY